MKRILYIIIFSNIFLINALCQRIEIGYNQGIGSCKMADFKRINEQIIQNLPFESKLVNNFPVFLYYRPFIMIKGTHIGIGLSYSFESTGSRISSKDYSGEYFFNTTLNSHLPSIYLEYSVYSFYNFEIGIYSNAGFTLTKLKMKECLKINEVEKKESIYKFNASYKMIEPGIELDYKLTFFGFKVTIGYLFHTKEEIFTAEEKQVFYSNFMIRSIKSDWNGFRTGVSVYYTINNCW